MKTILITADFNKRLSGELRDGAKKAGIAIDEEIDASSDDVGKYRPSAVPSLIAVHECGCKYLEIAEPVDVIIFGDLERECAGLPCACTVRKIESIEARLSEVIRKRDLALELGIPERIYGANLEIEALKEDWRGLHK